MESKTSTMRENLLNSLKAENGKDRKQKTIHRNLQMFKNTAKAEKHTTEWYQEFLIGWLLSYRKSIINRPGKRDIRPEAILQKAKGEFSFSEPVTVVSPSGRCQRQLTQGPLNDNPPMTFYGTHKPSKTLLSLIIFDTKYSI